jgi:hypothetical protein
MAIPRLFRHRLRSFVGALALGAAGCTIYPAAPAEPGYEADVQPIFLAHCTRCHGAGPDGGSLNAASVPNVSYNAAGPPKTIGPYLTQFGDTCPASPDGGAGNCNSTQGCVRCGALSFAKLTQMRVHLTNALEMPPAPAPRLNDWELKVIDAWAANPLP